MTVSFYYGHDYGNSTVAGVTFAGEHRYGSLVFPSLSAPGSVAELERIRGALDRPLYGTGEFVLDYAGMETYHGNLAFEARDATSSRADVSRYWSDGSVRALLVASASIIHESDYELFVVTGLPIETYTKENRKYVKHALEGEHRFFLNGQPRRAIVHVSRVIMEGAGALIAFGDTENVKQGAVDIGGQTTDLFATQGQVPRVDWCKGKPVGVERMASLFNTTASEVLAGYTFSPEDIQRILRAYASGTNYPALYWQGNPIPRDQLIEWVEKAIHVTAKEITSFLAQTWRTNERGNVAADFARVVLVGGGAYYFRSALAQCLPHVRVPHEPEIANALGYGALAQSLGPQRSLRIA